MPKEVVDWELKRFKKLHKKELGNDFVTLVPPRHSPPPRKLLKNMVLKLSENHIKGVQRNQKSTQ